MAVHTIRKGLALPITGAPRQEVEAGPAPHAVGVVAADYVGLKPTMHVSVGDDIQRGQLLMEDKTLAGVRHTAPAEGRVLAVNRGDRRALQSVVIELSRGEREGRPDTTSFSAFSGRHPSGLADDEVRSLLVESGLWTALRARPFSRVANPDVRPHSIFVTAIDTNPLAASVEAVMMGAEGAFDYGLFALSRLTEGPLFVCTPGGSTLRLPAIDRLRHEEFSGPHPAGTVGLHIHRLDPVDRQKVVWHVGYQDVIAIGRLFERGDLSAERVIALAGPSVRNPRLLRTRLGVSLDDLARDELHESDAEHRVISGSVLSGRAAAGDVFGYLGRYHQQVSVLAEGLAREFLGWLGPGFDKYSTINTFASTLLPGRRFAFTTSTNGSPRAIIPLGMYERVMPMDLLPTFLARALVMRDVEKAEELGCLELDEEDLALCSFVCPGKTDFGPPLRDVLMEIEKKG
ncbi:MAG: Na(+)-translocating NADH-quinone reductase subunit A [Vicinamibacterales bacterium]|jgi:Na+-transporting NADH:ubiquinone oxidoreductase subunit A|nr:Na(+)-translocating NADH-quinone reductase subunit A [Vicinamibacterales bacterium]MDP7672128.1 Na(+)-translocating NADH-quinone reductase subunit A [Vicinamibacterales bacterium]HJO39560.1 Na(+)-translocating NADH-quinone reductase subunit A [Vicinamibacterales bacterium]|tara:strand:+ start:572 stop:1948 length:1377 start_codon:yes stop_codon:yes gene_type:complete